MPATDRDLIDTVELLAKVNRQRIFKTGEVDAGLFAVVNVGRVVEVYQLAIRSQVNDFFLSTTITPKNSPQNLVKFT